MLMEYLPRGRYFFRLLSSLTGLLFFVAGCVTPLTRPDTRRKLLSAWEMLSSIRRRNDQISSLRTITRLTITTPEDQKNFNAILLVQRPHFIRLEAVNMFMQPMYFFVLNEDGLLWYAPADKKAVKGAADSLNIYRLLGIRLSAAELVDVLLGCIPLPAAGNIQPELTYIEADYRYLLKFCQDTNRCSHKIWLHPYRLYGMKLVQTAESARQWQVSWGGFEQLTDIYLPTSIKVERLDQSSRLELKYKKPVINEAIPPDKFQLKLPPDVEIVFLDNQPPAVEQ